MTTQRIMLVVLLALALLMPFALGAQETSKVYRVALVFTTSPASVMAAPDPVHPLPRAFLRALSGLGYVDGKNLVYLPRSAEGKLERLGDILKELAGLKVDVIVAPGDDIPRRAKEVAPTVPFVMMSITDPVDLGLVASLAQPGGNITGLTRSTGAEVEGKRVQLLKEALPDVRRVAFLGTEHEWKSPSGQSVQSAARLLGITLLQARHSPADYSEAFSGIVRDRPDAVFVADNTSNFAHRKRIVDFATQNRLPSIYYTREFVEVGGLMSYGADLADLYRRAAVYVDKILKGAKPATLPVERPAKFELVINVKTAKALGFSIAPSVLVRADQVIE
jgi:putative ABC transport system substrate-binding protein